MSFTQPYNITAETEYHRHQVAREFAAARESSAAMRRMFSLVSRRPRSSAATPQAVDTASTR